MNKHTLFVMIVHFAINIIIQNTFSIRMVFFYDYTVINIIIWAIIFVLLIGIDYTICGFILRDTHLKHPLATHSVDLIMAVPNVTYSCMIAAKDGKGFKLTHYEIALIAGIMLIDCLLVLERIKLIRRHKDHGL